MFSKMLIATDLSDASEKMVCALGEMKKVGTREALLIHCFNVRDVGGISETVKEQYEPILQRQKKLIEEMGYSVTAKMVAGLPQIEINRLADESDCSLIVVGSAGQSLLGALALGGVASTVIHSANRPTLVLRLKKKDDDAAGACADVQCNPLEHVLFSTDFSDNAEQAFAYVEKLAQSGTKTITLLHVQDQARIDKHLKARLDEFNQTDRARLNRLKEVLEKHGVKDVRIELPYGSPKQEILKRIEQDPGALVVMGSQGRGAICEVMLGSVSHAVARRSPAAVLLVPMKV